MQQNFAWRQPISQSSRKVCNAFCTARFVERKTQRSQNYFVPCNLLICCKILLNKKKKKWKELVKKCKQTEKIRKDGVERIASADYAWSLPLPSGSFLAKVLQSLLVNSCCSMFLQSSFVCFLWLFPLLFCCLRCVTRFLLLPNPETSSLCLPAKNLFECL